MVDGFADADQFKASVAKLDSLGINGTYVAGQRFTIAGVGVTAL